MTPEERREAILEIGKRYSEYSGRVLAMSVRVNELHRQNPDDYRILNLLNAIKRHEELMWELDEKLEALGARILLVRDGKGDEVPDTMPIYLYFNGSRIKSGKSSRRTG